MGMSSLATKARTSTVFVSATLTNPSWTASSVYGLISAMAWNFSSSRPLSLLVWLGTVDDLDLAIGKDPLEVAQDAIVRPCLHVHGDRYLRQVRGRLDPQARRDQYGEGVP